MLFINILALALIALIIWWFWLYKPSVKKTLNSLEKSASEQIITVQDGIYQPANISVIADKATKIKFLRKDASPCAGTVLFPDFEISAELPLDKVIEITLPAMTAGEYAFHCQMQMYKGSVIAN
jgi:plastocyanin domain-containing protein